MKQSLCRVVENERLWGNVQRIVFDAPELALAFRPGQFALVRDPTSFDPYLRRKAWFYSTDRQNVSLILEGSDPLAVRTQRGAALDLLAPLGHPIELPASAQHVLVVGLESRITPLVSIAQHAIQDHRAVVVHAIGEGESEHFPAHLLAPEIEYHTGTSLEPGLLSWADIAIASGNRELYVTLSDLVRNTRFRLEYGFLHVLPDRVMPCGTGECYACSVQTTRGIRLACLDGPLFDWAEMENRRRR